MPGQVVRSHHHQRPHCPVAPSQVFRLDPSRWMKATAPICADALSSCAAPGQCRCRHCATTRKKMRSAQFSAALSRCMKVRSRFGTDSTHWRTGRWGKTGSTRCAAVWAMRRALHEGHPPRPLQAKATKKSCAQSSHLTRASRKVVHACIFLQAPGACPPRSESAWPATHVTNGLRRSPADPRR